MKKKISILLAMFLILSSSLVSFAGNNKPKSKDEDFNTMGYLTTYKLTYKDVTMARTELMDLRDDIRLSRTVGSYSLGLLIGAFGLVPGLNLTTAAGIYATGAATGAASAFTTGADGRIDKILRDYPSTQTFYVRVQANLELDIHMVVQKVTFTDVLYGMPWTPGMDGIGIAEEPPVFAE